ncbi:MAG: hypothetical protein HRT38_16325 [Alteromonadaceae bacterium]|nr:hypothetical protein [Alteromonadaceae bacterium]
MNKNFLFIIALLCSSQSFAHSFNCNIKEITNNSSTPNLVYITMGCAASGQWETGTGGCTAAVISDDTVVIDGTSEIGKRYYSLALTAMATQKSTIISAYGTCPSDSPSTPVVYSMKVSNA